MKAAILPIALLLCGCSERPKSPAIETLEHSANLVSRASQYIDEEREFHQRQYWELAKIIAALVYKTGTNRASLSQEELNLQTNTVVSFYDDKDGAKVITVGAWLPDSGNAFIISTNE